MRPSVGRLARVAGAHVGMSCLLFGAGLIRAFGGEADSGPLLDAAAAAAISGSAGAEASFQRPSRGPASRGVYKAQMTPHWLRNDAGFWYRNDLADGTREFILVDAIKGTRDPGFDHRRLAKALSGAG